MIERFRLVRLLAIAGASLLLAAAPQVTAPPPALKLDPFYAKHVDARGIPIVSSQYVSDAALLVARSLVEEMFAHRPELARVLAEDGFRIAIMSTGEGTLDLPEQRDWKKPARDDPRLTRCERIHYDERIGKLTDAQYWNNRTRGMAGPLTSGAMEDLLGDRYSRYYGETVFVHEVAHSMLGAIRSADPKLYRQVEAAYAAALKAGRWRGEYASTTLEEYWAEGTQFWFNSNRIAIFDGRRILSDRDLARYDRPLAAVLRAAYGDRHRLAADPWWMSPARVPPGPLPRNTAEVC